MNHITDDGLLAFVLDAQENPTETAEQTAHLEECESCRNRLERLRRDVDVIGGLEPRGKLLRPPAARTRRVRALPLLRAAALLAIGFVLGFGLAVRRDRAPARVLPAYLKTEPPPDSLHEFAAADATRPDPRRGGWFEP
jgi:hypothetical protein